jgi:hypothetical protein
METLTTEPSRAPTPAQAHARRLERERAVASPDTSITLDGEADSSLAIIDKRTFSRDEKGISITANSFNVEPLPDESDLDQSTDAILQSTEQDTTVAGVLDADVLSSTADASTAEQDTTPEKKKKVWFKRLGYAASMNFKIARGIGVKNYAGEIKDSIQTAVSEKIDAAKAKVYQKTEETLWKLADEINTATEKVSGTYKRTKEELGAEYTAFKQGFTADLENAMGMWIAYREQARIDKAARKKYVNDRIMKYALQREKQFALAGTRGAGL